MKSVLHSNPLPPLSNRPSPILQEKRSFLPHPQSYWAAIPQGCRNLRDTPQKNNSWMNTNGSHILLQIRGFSSTFSTKLKENLIRVGWWIIKSIFPFLELYVILGHIIWKAFKEWSGITNKTPFILLYLLRQASFLNAYVCGIENFGNCMGVERLLVIRIYCWNQWALGGGKLRCYLHFIFLISISNNFWA